MFTELLGLMRRIKKMLKSTIVYSYKKWDLNEFKKLKNFEGLSDSMHDLVSVGGGEQL